MRVAVPAEKQAPRSRMRENCRTPNSFASLMPENVDRDLFHVIKGKASKQFD